jgi:hypothetical protein
MAFSRCNNLRELALTELYRPDSGKIELAHFWSVGPVFSGIMKLDVAVPISANSGPDLWPNDDVQDSPYVYMDVGTSMACPKVAGAVGFVMECLREYYGIVLSSSLLKAILILSASPIDPIVGYGGFNSNLEFGFGQLNFANLGLDASFQLLLGDQIPIDDESYLMATVAVSENRARPLRVVVSCLDIPLSQEVPFPLAFEFCLSVVGPKGAIYWMTERRCQSHRTEIHTLIDVPGIPTIFVDMNCGMRIHLFLVDDDPPAMLRDYSEPYFSSRHWNMSFEPDTATPWSPQSDSS